MASESSWKKDEYGIPHPEKHILLAFIRQQTLEDREQVAEHLSGCKACQEIVGQLERDIALLDAFRQATPYRYYPMLTPAHILAHAQGGVPKRTRWLMRKQHAGTRLGYSRRVGFGVARLSNVATIFSLVVLIAVTLVVLTYVRPSLSINNLYKGGSSFVTGVAPRKPSPTAQPARTATLPSATASSGGTPGTQAKIAVCSTAADIANYRLVICGYNFQAGDRVTLMVFTSSKIIRYPVTVNPHGQFSVSGPLNCRSMPLAIIAIDTSDKPPVYSNMIMTISQRCQGLMLSPTKTPRPGTNTQTSRPAPHR